jgi:hypothetical protein
MCRSFASIFRLQKTNVVCILWRDRAGWDLLCVGTDEGLDFICDGKEMCGS